MSFTFQSSFQSISGFRVPYATHILGGLQPGKAIFIQGAVPSGSASFEVNLICEESGGDDIAFQIRPQFSSNYTALNSRQSGLWGKEEKQEFPLKQGSSFDMIIAANPENYQVFLSGSEVGQFQHRIPLERVTALEITGEVSLTNVAFTEGLAESSISEEGGSMLHLKDGARMEGSWSWSDTTYDLQTEFSLSNPVQNPNLPYVGPITGGLREGMALYVKGVVPSNAGGFQLNFKTGASENDDTAFRFNPRMDQKVALNSSSNGAWGTEESLSDNPFKKGQAFEMFTAITSQGYQVYVNGKEQYTFKHRIPLERVSTLNVCGDVALDLFGFIQNWSASMFPTGDTKTITSMVSSCGEWSTTQFGLQPAQGPNLSYVGQIPGGLKEGMALCMQGVVPDNANQFEINFKTGPSDSDDTAFQFKPRMDQKVALNSFRNGAWGTEESVSDNPFKKGQPFKMLTAITSAGYQVFVNDKELCTFKHRLPLDRVSTLNFSGDVAINSLGSIQNWSTSSPVTEIKSTITSLGSSCGDWSTTQFEILQPVQNPNLPYVGPISGGLREGMALYLQGVVPNNANQFEINFKTGQSGSDDIAFQFKPRMDQKVAMNSFRNGAWGTEESVSDNPFKKGQPFKMFTAITSAGYQVFVNDKELCTFKHRLPLDRVSALNISGDAAISLLGSIKNWSTSSSVTEVKPTITNVGSSRGDWSTTQMEISQPVQNPNLPYVGPISGGLREGMALYLQGVVPNNANQFEINFKTGQSGSDDIAFQFKPRMDQKVALNSFRNGAWGTEESVSDNPFKKGQPFKMFTAITSAGYQVFVNDKELCTFKHRLPLDRVSALNISGDAVISLLGSIKNWSTSSSVTEVKPTITNVGSSRGDWSTTQFEILQPVQNPNLPYVGPIPGGMREGMALYLQGVVPDNAKQFEINFKTGQSGSDDIAFHFNPRMDQKVALNSFRNGAWGTEESVSDNPFKKGQPFKMFTAITSAGYQVFVNDKELCTFKHRLPLDRVSALNISGDAVINSLGSIQNWKTSPQWSTKQFEILQPVQNPNLPYVGPIPGGVREGMALYLQGVVPDNAKQFEVNFKTGQTGSDDIAFHFNPRMDQKVALNSFRNGAWGTEESVSDNPFKKGQPFKMFTAITSAGYQVFVNDKELCTFKHRLPLDRVSALNISGDAVINSLGSIQNWSTSSSVTEVKPTITNVGSSRGDWSTTQMEISQPVQNPNLPRVIQIPRGLREGMILFMKGTVPANANRFEINLKTGPSGSDDIAFQFNPRLDKEVVMNSLIGGKLGTEETISDNPFKKGEPFKMLTYIKPEGYQVLVNGKEQCLFKHRIPYERVSAINITGDVLINNSEISDSVQNPKLPYMGKISGVVREGMALHMQGVVPDNAKQFEINLKTGQSGSDDIAFHFNPRMDQKVAMNSFRNGAWGTEESVSDNPFKKGQPFKMLTVITSAGYQVYVNDKELCTFKHRLPLDRVSALNISGDAVINSLGSMQNWSTPVTEVNLGATQLEILQPVQNPNLPYVGPISGGLREGMALYLQGVVSPMADKFEINFKTGPSGSDDIAFHFNPRMNQKVAMNSLRNGALGTEESVSDNPFKKGQAFEMFTVLKPEGYQVYVDGKEQCTFNHRIPLDKVSHLNIDGGVGVNLLGFVQNWSKSSFASKVKPKSTCHGGFHKEHSTTHSEIFEQVLNPDLPYVGSISGGLREGMALYLQGVVLPMADKFEINFKTGRSGSDDTAFHFSPRMDQKVTLNSFRKGAWGTEESVSDNPFKKGQAFEMLTVCRPEGYQVYVDGKEQCTFNHRIPLDKVSNLNIDGGVGVNLLGFIKNWSKSSFASKVKPKSTCHGGFHKEHSTTHSDISQAVQNPNLPYVGSISGGLREGMALYLQGVVPPKAEKFEINFKTGPSGSDDTAFHFSPRMDQKVAMKCFRKGAWGTEEHVSDNPFKKGQAFEMLTVCRPEGYQVYVDGKEQCTFNHRIPLDKVSHLNITGGVGVNLLGFVQNWSKSSFASKVKPKSTCHGGFHKEHSTTHSEIFEQVLNPDLPYVGSISGGLREGMALYLQGVVSPMADKFEINFKTGRSGSDDTAFHFSPRMDQKVTLNSFRKGAWGTEESVSDNPFKKGQAFEMLTVCRPEGYQVYVDGKEQCTFNHRIPLDKVSNLNIDGGVGVNLLGFIKNWSKSSFASKVKPKSTCHGGFHKEHSTTHSEISQPVQNPNLPYVGSISGGLREGMALYLQGVVSPMADKFEINFKTGPSGSDDTAFHFSPRMDQKVAMKCFRKGAWGTEEHVSDNPFKKGQAFEMLTVCRPEGYQVYVDGKEQCTFNHRIPLDKVSHLNIDGGVGVNLLGFVQNWSKSSFASKVKPKSTCHGGFHKEHSTTHSEIFEQVLNPDLPYVGSISGGLREGMALYLQGVVSPMADKFEINFKTGRSGSDDTAFHFSPRMDQKVTLNSFRKGAWGTEESVSDNPFKKGQAFEMLTVCRPEGYQVYVDGKEQCTFNHRIPLDKVSHLNITGGVGVNLLGFVQNWSKSSFATNIKSTITSLGSLHKEQSTTHSEISQAVQNPNLPYVGSISGGLREGMALYLQGVVPPKGDKFEINFKTGPSGTDDIAFHFNPRMDQKVAMNSFRNGRWETEEYASDNPFKRGGTFEMFTVITSAGYQVYMNGKEQYTFKHRIPLGKVSTLNIVGGVGVNLLGFIQNWSKSSFISKVKSTITSLGSLRWDMSTIQSKALQAVQNPNLPYVGQIPGGLREGMALYMKGVVPGNSDRFSLNFKTGPTDNHDIAFHFNPRMGSKVVMNSLRGKAWGVEEHISDNPFKKGEAFEMFIFIKAEGYQVHIKGQQYSTFKHRIPLEKVTTINVAGNVSVGFLGFVMGM